MDIALRITGFTDIPYDNSVNDYLIKESIDWANLVLKYPLLKMEPRIKSVSSKSIVDIQNETIRLTDIGEINLLAYFTVLNVKEDEVEQLFQELDQIPGFEPLYWESDVRVNNLAPSQELLASDPLYTQQTYLHGNNAGIDIDSVRNVNGNRGDYLQLKIIEEGCFTQHPDFAGLNLALVGNNTSNDDTGTAVVSIIGAQENGAGMIGITPNLHHMAMYSPMYNGGKLSALMYAIITSHDNTVILISDQHMSFNGQANLPYEVAEDIRDAIKLAIARDIIVIQAAGDGGRNLDSYQDYRGRRIFDFNSNDYDKSNSIMVAASSYSSVIGLPPHSLSSFSNFGNCVSGFAQGENIVVGIKDSLSTIPYYGLRSGTALSAAIVAGAVLSFKGMVLVAKGFNFKMRMLHQIWSASGITYFNASRMPVMNKLHRFIKDVVDIYSRDFIGDIGNRNITGKLQSPDIFVSDRFIQDPQSEYGTGSGNEHKHLNVNVEYGQDNYCYVRVLNRSANTAISNIVNLYYNNASPLASPKSWKLIGQAFIERVEPGIITVSPAIRWTADKLPKKGHYCFIVTIDNVFDPAPSPFRIQSSQQFLEFIKNNNNAVWRNFNVVDNNPNNTSHPSREINEAEFVLDFFYNEEMSLKVYSDIPSTGKLIFEFPEEIVPYLTGNVTHSNYRPRKKILEIKTPCLEEDIIINKVLNFNESPSVKLQYYIPRTEREKEYRVELIQFYKTEEIGRITWLIKTLDSG